MITHYRLTRYQLPRARPIGDSQIRVDSHNICTLELTDDDGLVGPGFFGALLTPLPPLSELNRMFEHEAAPALLASERPGHGLTLSEPARAELARPDVEY